MRLTSLAAAILLFAVGVSAAAAQKGCANNGTPRLCFQPPTRRPPNPMRSEGVEATIAAIANQYGLRMTAQATAAQLAANAITLTKVKAWASNPATHIDVEARQDFLYAVARLQKRNEELITHGVQPMTSIQDQRQAVLPKTLP
jgi:hypothetical protein